MGGENGFDIHKFRQVEKETDCGNICWSYEVSIDVADVVTTETMVAIPREEAVKLL